MDSPSSTGYGGELGLKLTVGPLMIQGNGHYSQNMGHQFMQLVQIASGENDIAGFGFWGQAGFEMPSGLGIYAFFGMEDPDDEDVLAGIPISPAGTMPPQAAGTLPRLLNIQAAGMIRYKVGQFQIGLEYLFDQLTFQDLMGEADVSANQVSLSGWYGF